MSSHAAIALGSNLDSEFGSPTDNLRAAIDRISALGRILALSSFRQTRPVGYTQQPDFVNAVLLLETDRDPANLMRMLLAIERAMGRSRAGVPSKGPRIIDLDLLLMDNLVIETPELTLPHIAMAERRFVLEPLAEIAPTMVHPLLGRTIAELLALLQSSGN